MVNFTHLHFHSDYSVRDGFVKVEDLVKFCKDREYSAACITDHGNIGSSLKLYLECKKAAIKPIIGCELYISEDPNKENYKDKDHLVLLCKNEIGFRNLIKITSEAWINNCYGGKPIAKYDTVYKNSEGLICLTACAAGKASKLITQKNLSGATKFLKKLWRVFRDDLYIELLMINYKPQVMLNRNLASIANQQGFKTVITNDCHYLHEEGKRTHDIVLLLSSNATVSSKNKWTFETDDLYFKSYEDMEENYIKKFHLSFDDDTFSESIYHIEEIINKVEPFKIDNSMKYPEVFKDKEELTDMIVDRCMDKLKKIKKIEDIYVDRLFYEIKTLKELNYLDYFWILSDITDYARTLDKYAVGCGRGSAAGCLVAYLLDITDVDPIRWNLLFERFINIGRIDPPDIDVDFIPELRNKIKEYIFKKYPGKSASIGTYGELRFRACLQDLARVFDVNVKDALSVTKRLTSDVDEMDLNMAKEKFDFLGAFIKKYPQIEQHFNRLYGSIRNVSKHAAGVLISNEKIDGNVPLMKSGDDIITAWKEGKNKELSKLGFMKFDILGLNAISILSDALHLIENNNDEVDINLIDYEDKEVFKVCNELNLCGIFQFDTQIAKQQIKALKPSSLMELSNITSLGRPGILKIGMDRTYKKNKFGKQHRIIPEIDDILNETYGVIIYQEQIMKICERIGGFSLSEADSLRRILVQLAKRSGENVEEWEETKQLKSKFMKNSSNYISKRDADSLWKEMASFAEYGFNKSHSVSYSLIGYRQLWLKTYYPLEFYCALLMNTNVNKEKSSGIKEIKLIINELINCGIQIRPPDVNISDINFSIINDEIVWGLSCIKNISLAANELIKHRPFKSLEDLKEKVNKRIVNKRVVDALLASGALDSIHKENISQKDKREKELEYLNVNLKYRTQKKSKLANLSKFTVGGKHSGVLTGIREIKTKKNKTMAFIEFEEISESVIVWPDVYKEVKKILKRSVNELIEFRCSMKGDSIIFDKIYIK
jgi:DNA polymerase-3 subunit alpha